MQTEQRYLSDQEKAETDMSASAGSSMSRTAVRMAVMAAAVAMSSLKLMKVLTHFRISDIAKNSQQKTENRVARDAAMEKMLKISF